MAFTDKGIQGLKPKTAAYRVYERGSDPGFCIRITPAGTKTFQLAYKIAGRQRFMRLGTYPAMTLAEAREEARAARKLLDQGIDPQEERDRRAREELQRQAEEAASGTVKQLFQHYVDTLKAQGKDWKEVERALLRDALPELGAETPAKTVTSLAIAGVLSKVLERGAASMANHLRRYLHRAWQLGIHHDNDPRNLDAEVKFGIPFNPVANVPHDVSAEKAGTRELSWSELRAVWLALDDYVSAAHAIALRLLMCCGLRVREVIHAELAEFDLEQRLWRIPAERIKSRHKRRADHLLPITDQMAEQIERAMAIAGPKSRYLFPGHSNPRSGIPMHDSSLQHAAADVAKAIKIPHFTPRDLRRTWKTRGGELGIPREHRNLVQNHARTDVATVHYDVWEYLDEKRQALELFCNHLEAVITADDGKVVPIKRRA